MLTDEQMAELAALSYIIVESALKVHIAIKQHGEEEEIDSDFTTMVHDNVDKWMQPIMDRYRELKALEDEIDYPPSITSD